MRYYIGASAIDRETKKKTDYFLFISNKNWEIYPYFMEKDHLPQFLEEKKEMETYIFTLEDVKKEIARLTEEYQRMEIRTRKTNDGEERKTISDVKDPFRKPKTTFEFYPLRVDSSNCPFKVGEKKKTKTKFIRASIVKK